jgi:hypothetical protein
MTLRDRGSADWPVSEWWGILKKSYWKRGSRMNRVNCAVVVVLVT